MFVIPKEPKRLWGSALRGWEWGMSGQRVRQPGIGSADPSQARDDNGLGVNGRGKTARPIQRQALVIPKEPKRLWGSALRGWERGLSGQRVRQPGIGSADPSQARDDNGLGVDGRGKTARPIQRQALVIPREPKRLWGSVLRGCERGMFGQRVRQPGIGSADPSQARDDNHFGCGLRSFARDS